MSIVDVFDHHASEIPNNLAICAEAEGSSLTWKELQTTSLVFARLIFDELSGLSIGPVALLLPRTPKWLAASVAVLRCGRPFVWMSAAELSKKDSAMEQGRNREVLEVLRPPLVIVDESIILSKDFYKDVFQVVQEMPKTLCLPMEWTQLPQGSVCAKGLVSSTIELDPVMCFMFTGGTTGKSKCVAVTHLMALHESVTYPKVAPGLGKGDRVLQHTPVLWAATTLGQVDIALAFGATLVISANAERSVVQRSEITVLGVVPSTLESLEPLEIPTVHTIFTWGEALPPATGSRWRRGQKEVLELLISTEYWLSFVNDGSVTRNARSVFRAIDGLDFAVLPVGDSSPTKELGRPGELCIRGPMVMQGYVHVGASAEESFIDTGDKEGRFFRTRDVVQIVSYPGNALGIEFCGRNDQMIKVSGKWVDLSDVEERLRSSLSGDEIHVDICMVPASSNAPGTPVAHAFICFRKIDAPDAHAAAKFLQLARAQLPRGVSLHVLESFPLHPVTEKVNRNALLESLDASVRKPLPVAPMLRAQLRRHPLIWAGIIIASSLDIRGLIGIALAGRWKGRIKPWLQSCLRQGFRSCLRSGVFILMTPYLWLTTMYFSDGLRNVLINDIPFGRLGLLCLLHSARHCKTFPGQLMLVLGAVSGAWHASRRKRLMAWWLAFWVAVPGPLWSECVPWLTCQQWSWYRQEVTSMDFYQRVMSEFLFAIDRLRTKMKRTVGSSSSSQSTEIHGEADVWHSQDRSTAARRTRESNGGMYRQSRWITEESYATDHFMRATSAQSLEPTSPGIDQVCRRDGHAMPDIDRDQFLSSPLYKEWEDIWRSCASDDDLESREPGLLAPEALQTSHISDALTSENDVQQSQQWEVLQECIVPSGETPSQSSTASKQESVDVTMEDVQVGCPSGQAPFQSSKQEPLDGTVEVVVEFGASFSETPSHSSKLECSAPFGESNSQTSQPELVDGMAEVMREYSAPSGATCFWSSDEVELRRNGGVGRDMVECRDPGGAVSDAQEGALSQASEENANVDSSNVSQAAGAARPSEKVAQVWRCSDCGDVLKDDWKVEDDLWYCIHCFRLMDDRWWEYHAKDFLDAPPMCEDIEDNNLNCKDDVSDFENAPKTAVEARLLDIAKRAMPGTAVGANGSLLGADSMAVMSFCRVVRIEFPGVSLQPQDVFQNPVLRDLADHIEGQVALLADAATTSEDVTSSSSRSQERTVWFAPGQYQGSTCKWIYGCSGLLDEGVFEKAAQRLILRHEALRAALVDHLDFVRFFKDPCVLHLAFWPHLLQVIEASENVPSRVKSVATSLVRMGQRACASSLRGAWPRVSAKPQQPRDLWRHIRVVQCSSWDEVVEAAKSHTHSWASPFSIALYQLDPPPWMSNDCISSEPKGPSSFVHFIVNHAFADGYTSVPLINDFSALYEAEATKIDGRDAEAPWLGPLPSALEELEERFFDALNMQPMQSHPDQQSMRGSIFQPTSIRSSWCYNHEVLVDKGAVAALRNCAKLYGIPFDVLIFSLVVMAMFRSSPRMQEGTTGFTLYAPLRDGPVQDAMVGLFSDWRDLGIRCGHGVTVVGQSLQIASLIRHRQWSVFDATQNQEQILFNILPLDEQVRGGLKFQQTRLHEYGNKRFEQRERRGWKATHRPARITLEQEAMDAWWISMDLNASRFSTGWCRRFVGELGRTLEDLMLRPLTPLICEQHRRRHKGQS